jgi:hypothetical protein
MSGFSSHTRRVGGGAAIVVRLRFPSQRARVESTLTVAAAGDPRLGFPPDGKGSHRAVDVIAVSPVMHTHASISKK